MPNNEEDILIEEVEQSFLESDDSALGDDIGFEFDDELEVPDTTLDNSALVQHINNELIHVLHPCWFKVSGNISEATNVDLSWIAPVPLNIVEVYGYIRTPPVGLAALIDINKNGTSIFATRLTIADGANTGSQRAIRITGQPHLNINDRLDIDVDQIGSTTAGANLSVFIRFQLV